MASRNPACCITDEQGFAAQVRAARALLNITRSNLARAAKISVATLNDIENARARMRPRTQQALLHCFASAGIRFLEDSGERTEEALGLYLYRRSRPCEPSPEHDALLDLDALLAPRQVLLFLACRAERAPTRLAVEIVFPHRRVLLDHGGFALSAIDSKRLGRFLLAACTLYAERLFSSEPSALETLSLSNYEAYALVARVVRKPLSNPLSLLSALAESSPPSRALLQECLRDREHPFARVRDLVDAAKDF